MFIYHFYLRYKDLVDMINFVVTLITFIAAMQIKKKISIAESTLQIKQCKLEYIASLNAFIEQSVDKKNITDDFIYQLETTVIDLSTKHGKIDFTLARRITKLKKLIKNPKKYTPTSFRENINLLISYLERL